MFQNLLYKRFQVQILFTVICTVSAVCNLGCDDIDEPTNKIRFVYVVDGDWSAIQNNLNYEFSIQMVSGYYGAFKGNCNFSGYVGDTKINGYYVHPNISFTLDSSPSNYFSGVVEQDKITGNLYINGKTISGLTFTPNTEKGILRDKGPVPDNSSPALRKHP
ncbi:MAG: hypothetical protein LWX56_07685 [Ignavibacteria bacterium]|nr:hypothetical protein [Ignavibacteria bacterium]